MCGLEEAGGKEKAEEEEEEETDEGDSGPQDQREAHSESMQPIDSVFFIRTIELAVPLYHGNERTTVQNQMIQVEFTDRRAKSFAQNIGSANILKIFKKIQK